ncbi:MAG: inorganic phosphate transporter [Verrucomicrobiaceae bacterium]|nr:inorganic phosphate transporter [Verrucomicrobiaceae bacterium]
MHFLADVSSNPSLVFLVLAVGLALAFEFVNGFHDTANAVATVIYTHTLKPQLAVVWSGIWNLIGVLTSSGAVAFGIVSLLPVELVLNVGSGAGFAMVFSLLISAIIWNMGTWWLGLPASSSHTLIGSIIGVGLANSYIKGHGFGEGVNWAKAQEVGISLLVSPLVGFTLAGLMLLLLKAVVKNRELFTEPPKDKTPPFFIRCILMLTCTGVSFAHGSNDGQKGMGLIVLILVGMLPGTYALNMGQSSSDLALMLAQARKAQVVYTQKAAATQVTAQEANDELQAFIKPAGKVSDKTYAALAVESQVIGDKVAKIQTFNDLPEPERRTMRTDIYLVAAGTSKILKAGQVSNVEDKKTLSEFKDRLDGVTKFIPLWVKVAVAIALGLGTMIGWKRIVVTVGEKIGKTHLTYAQGASAELVAMATIMAADTMGLPVSTTHVLSSGIAGTMAANHSGLQMRTLRNILLAWVLTLPVCIFLGSMLFAFGNNFVLNWLGLK